MANNLLENASALSARPSLSAVVRSVAEIIDAFERLAGTGGAGAVGLLDSGSKITATDVEGALAELADRVRTQLVTFTMSAAAESANAIVVTANLVDLANTPVNRVQRFMAEVRLSTGLLATSSQFRLSETGAGAEVSTTANPTMVMATDANGDATITVLDQSATYTGVAYLILTPMPDGSTQFFGLPRMIALTFA